MVPSRPSSEFERFIAEVRHRRVFRFTFGYAAAAFVVLQLAEIVFPAFELGDEKLRVLVVAVAVGFIPAVVLAWIYDLTLTGIRRTEAIEIVRGKVKLGALGAVSLLVLGGSVAYLVLSTHSGGSAAEEPWLIRSVVVLPLADLSPEPGHAYLAAGIHEELIAQLTRLDGLRVVSRTSALHYTATTRPASEIARELGVDVLIEGSVRRTGDRVRVILHLVHAPSDSHMGTLEFDREFGDILELQTEAAHALALALASNYRGETLDPPAAPVSGAARASGSSTGAHEAYLRGLYQYERGTPEGQARAIEHFTRALEHDPDFAAALAALAGARFVTGLEGDSASGRIEIERARRDAYSALDLDSSSVEAREVLTLIEREMASGGSETRAADDGWTSMVTRLGQGIAERIRRLTSAAEEDPVARDAAEARHLIGSGRFTEASQLLEGVVASVPEDPESWEMLVKAYVASGQMDEAAAAVRQWHGTGARRAPEIESVVDLEDAVEAGGAEGYWAWTLERLESARARGEDVALTDLAAAHAGLGHTDEALMYLLEAWKRGERGVSSLESDPIWDNLRPDERFQVLVREVRAARRPDLLPEGAIP